jgi:hypothetical protein
MECLARHQKIHALPRERRGLRRAVHAAEARRDAQRRLGRRTHGTVGFNSEYLRTALQEQRGQDAGTGSNVCDHRLR